MSDRRRDATATLARLGVDAAAVERGEVDVEHLVALVAGAEGAALAGALGELASPAAAALLVALEGRAPDRSTRKQIRLALYRLRQRGVAIPEPPMPAAPKPHLGPVPEGLVSHFDGRGDRLLWIVRPETSGPSLLITAQVNEPEGIRDVHAGEMSRKQLRTVRERLEKSSELRLVRADWRVLDALLVEGQHRAGATKRETDYLRLRPRLTSEPPAAGAGEPVSTRAQPPLAAEYATLAADSAKLLDAPEFRTWWPDPAAAAPFVQEIAAVRGSPLLVSRAAQQERLVEILRRAAVTLVPPAVLARRLDGMAYVLAESGRGTLARQALAVAALLHAQPDDAIAVPFVTAYVERALGHMMAEDVEHQEEERRGSLVVTPAEFLKDRSSSHPRRTRG